MDEIHCFNTSPTAQEHLFYYEKLGVFRWALEAWALKGRRPTPQMPRENPYVLTIFEEPLTNQFYGGNFDFIGGKANVRVSADKIAIPPVKAEGVPQKL